MPMPMDLASLPLYLWERWHNVRLDAEGRDMAQILPWARATTLAFWWLLLSYGFLTGHRLAGNWGGRLAAAFIACEPCFLAHAGLATSDVAVTACLLALAYHFAAGRDSGWLRRVGLPALWFGLAMICKASALAFGPLCLFAVECKRLHNPSVEHSVGTLWSRWQPFRRDLVWILTLGMVLTFVYCGSDWEGQRSFGIWANGLSHGPLATVMVWLAEHLRIFPNAGDALVRQIAHNFRGHGVYILGQVDARSIWYYFPVALSMKLSLILLLLPVIVAILRPRALLNWTFFAAACLLVYSLNCRVQIGIRFMLPLVALASIGLAAAVVEIGRSHRKVALRYGLIGLVGCGLLWTAATATTVWPNAICYTNELWGGTENGYRRLSDSNYDWGQGLRELAEWRDLQRLDNLDVWYFGSDAGINHSGFHAVSLHEPGLVNPDEGLRRVTGRFLAASTTLLYGSYGVSKNPARGPTPLQAMAEYLCRLEPFARTTTFLIYDLGDPQARTQPQEPPMVADRNR